MLKISENFSETLKTQTVWLKINGLKRFLVDIGKERIV